MSPLLGPQQRTVRGDRIEMMAVLRHGLHADVAFESSDPHRAVAASNGDIVDRIDAGIVWPDASVDREGGNGQSYGIPAQQLLESGFPRARRRHFQP
jgi:hypothetical protein